MKWQGWKHVEKDEEVPRVFVLNLDIAGSKKLESVLHPEQYKKVIREFQGETSKYLAGNNFHNDLWTGDGFITLFKDKDNNADNLIEKAFEIIHYLHDRNDKEYRDNPVHVRIGISIGTINFHKNIGKILCDAMNEAGMFQKSCPTNAGIFITRDVFKHAAKQELKKQFSETLLLKNKERQISYAYPQDSSKVIPSLVTAYSEEKLININELFGDKIELSKLDFYLDEIEKSVSAGESTIIITGRGPIWFYMKIALRLKPKTRELYFKDAKGEIYSISDESIS